MRRAIGIVDCVDERGLANGSMDKTTTTVLNSFAPVQLPHGSKLQIKLVRNLNNGSVTHSRASDVVQAACQRHARSH